MNATPASRTKLFAVLLLILVAVVAYRAWQVYNAPPVVPGESRFAQLEKQAAAGNADAQRALGRMLQFKEEGTPENLPRALELYRVAAAQGHMRAQKDLGWAYQNGLGVARDPAVAAQWYEKAAAQGEQWAQNNLGLMYKEGEGVPKNLARAREWFEKSAAQGTDYAEYNLGQLYLRGEGVPQDTARAVEWMQKAADRGYMDALQELAAMYMGGNGVKQDEERAVKLYTSAATRGSAQAQYALGSRYFADANPAKKKQGLDLLTRAAAAGDADARLMLGSLYLYGTQVPGDVPRGAGLLDGLLKDQEARQHHGAAATTAGVFFGSDGPSMDVPRAVAYFEKGVAEKYPDAFGFLAKLLGAGKGVPQDNARTLALLGEGARLQDGRSMALLGLALAEGRYGLKRDPALGYAHVYLASEGPNPGSDVTETLAWLKGKLPAAEQAKGIQLAKAAPQGTLPVR